MGALRRVFWDGFSRGEAIVGALIKTIAVAIAVFEFSFHICIAIYLHFRLVDYRERRRSAGEAQA